MNTQNVFISVIVPVYNSEEFLEACIQGLLAQCYPEGAYEIIMVDNNSTDGSIGIISRYPRIRLFREQRQGAYAARNRGLEKAKGSIIAFTDSDCIPDADWLNHIAEAMCDPLTHIALGGLRFASESPILSLLADYESEKAVYVCSSKNKSIYYGYTNNMATRGELFNRLGPFFEIDRGGDVVFVHRVLDLYESRAVRYTPKTQVRHLEISSIRDYYRKCNIYGKSLKEYEKLTPVRPLNCTERLQILRAVKRKRECSLAKVTLLFFVLLLGALCYELGRRYSGFLTRSHKNH